MTKDLDARGLITNDRLEEYDGTTAVVKSEHLGAEEIEFLRWKAERWMKLRHFPVALRHSPGFCLRHGPAMVAHTFRGARWKYWVGMESDRDVFRRYRQIRKAEREYLETPARSAR